MKKHEPGEDDSDYSVDSEGRSTSGDFMAPSFLRSLVQSVCNHRGFLAGMLSAFAFAISAACVRALKGEVGSLQMVFIRSFFITTMGLIYSVYTGVGVLRVTLRESGFHLLYAVVITVTMACQFYSFQNMRTADACAILYCYVVLTGLFSKILLKEPFHVLEGMFFLLSMTGVVFIIQPSFLFRGDGENGGVAAGDRPELFPVLSIIFACMMSALGAVILRHLAKTDTPVCRITVYFPAYSMALLLIPITASQQWVVPHCYMDRMLCVIVGFSSAWGLAALAYAMSVENTFYISLASMSELYFVFIFDIMIFGIKPEGLNLLGIALIVVACVSATVYKAYQRKMMEIKDRIEGSDESVAESTDVEIA